MSNEIIKVKLKPTQSIKTKTNNTYLWDPSFLGVVGEAMEDAQALVNQTAGLADEIGDLQDEVDAQKAIINDPDFQAVANNLSNVLTVGSNITNVNAVGTDIVNVNTVATDISDVSTVAGSIGNVNTVAGSIANVNTVATNITDINTVAGISSDISSVIGMSSDISSVVGISSDVSTVAGISSDVSTVSTNATDVNTVSTNITDINTVAANISQIADKANKDLGNVDNNIDFIIDSQEPTAYNNYTWYKLYKSGWVEQGGVSRSLGFRDTSTINLPIAFADTHYSLTSSVNSRQNYGNRCNSYSLDTKTTTTFQIYGSFEDPGSGVVTWVARGKANLT